MEDQTKSTENARKNLFRYMHYHNRYKAHMDSMKQEAALKETIQAKIAATESKDSSKIKDYSWVTNGLVRLFRSRRVISYSYPFAYYMFGDELFKDEMTPMVYFFHNLLKKFISMREEGGIISIFISSSRK
jgi:ariadne-1